MAEGFPGSAAPVVEMEPPAEDPEEMAEEDNGNLADKDFCFEGTPTTHRSPRFVLKRHFAWGGE